MWPMWFVISNFATRFFLLLKPQDNVKVSLKGGSESEQSHLYTFLRTKNSDPGNGKAFLTSCIGLQVLKFGEHMLKLSCSYRQGLRCHV